MKKLLLSGVMLLGLMGAALADNTPGQATTIDHSITVATANTFQTILGVNAYPTLPRLALTIENNNITGNCWIFLHSTVATKALSILLSPGQPYTRYFPYVPADAIQGTCDTNGNTLYVDTN